MSNASRAKAPKKAGFLYDRMLDKDFIRTNILDAAKGKRKRREVRRVLANLEEYVDKTYEMLVNDAFVPTPPTEIERYDESCQKWRTIKIVPFWPDGVVHWLIVSAMRDVLMRGMYHWSCASIPGRGNKRVRQYIEKAMRNDPKGTRYGEELDVRQYYPSISIRRLIRALARKIKDKRFLRLIYAILVSCGGGLAIGYYICQWLANFYLEPLDHFILTLPGVKYYTRHMDNLTILGPNKKQLHNAARAIGQFLWEKLGLILKKNWQVYRTTFTAAVEKAHRQLDERQQWLRRPRMVAAVGYRFSHTHTILRKRNFLRLTRQCRRARKRLETGRPIHFKMASGLLSRIGQLKHCDSHKAREKYVDPIKIKNLKEVVRRESKRRFAAEQCIHDRGAA